MALELGHSSDRRPFPTRRSASTPSVCLVTPPSAFLLDERVFVSLGVLKVAASLEAHGYRVTHLDFSGVENYLTALSNYLADCDDLAIGITPTTPQLPAVTKIARAIREQRCVPISSSSSAVRT
jgi:hypothetical protein